MQKNSSTKERLWWTAVARGRNTSLRQRKRMSLFAGMVSGNMRNGIWESTKDTLKIRKRDTNFRTATLEIFIGVPCLRRGAERANTDITISKRRQSNSAK